VEASSTSSVDLQALDQQIAAVGAALAEGMASARRRPGRAVDDRAMKLTSGDRELRAALFRLVDVTPACRDLNDLGHHLAGLMESVGERPPSIAAAMRIADTKPGRVALGAAVAAGVRHMAHRFIAGAGPNEALRELGRLWKSGIGTSVDLLGEATVSAAEADAYAARCEAALDALSAGSATWPSRPSLERDSAGALPRVNLSVKVSALTPVLHPEAPERGREDAATRLRPLLQRARDLGAHLHVDMESLDSRETTLGLVGELLGEDEFVEGPSVGLVVQAYLRDSPEELERVLSWAERTPRGPAHVVRLVKGAYWDHESAEAQQRGWSIPVFEDKAECDRNFEALTRRLLDSRPLVRVAIASHNLRSLAHAIAYGRLRGGDDRDLELQVLRGLGDELATAIAGQGLRARVYSPVGDLVAGMAYLVRRLLENASNDSFLFAQAEGAPLADLLAAP
jgi:RHH-type proline utilization regulon transcriptional repressor/proline dehydrogenase/delta 1-pyrroline-5-carboxylate dehydrogenase